MRKSTTLAAFTAILLSTTPIGLAANIGPHGATPQNATTPGGMSAGVYSIFSCADSTDAPWSSIGLSARPTWVNLCAERRLRLTPALPTMAQDIQNDANKYFGMQGPGLAVGLVLDDGLYYSQGFGYRDAQKAHAPDELTIFRAGSLSKVITGTGLLTLTDDPARQMSLGDDADDARYLPELKSVCAVGAGPMAWPNCRPAGANCTTPGTSHLGIKLKDLVSHTAGLADVMEQTKADEATWLCDLKKSWAIFSPGAFASYSGVSIEGVGLIEERVSGLKYADFIQKNLFAPLGMTHSTMNPNTSPANLMAQRWAFSLPKPYASWSFAADSNILAGDDQPMIWPAGGFATDVWDLARFMKMWLTTAPSVNGRALLNPGTIEHADQPQSAENAQPPDGCGDKSDPNNFYYSGCAKANGFGVNWYVGNKPYIMHNGDEPGHSGSETMIDRHGKIGATGLVSTEPYPNVPHIDGARVQPTQPAGLDGVFIDTVVWGHLMTEGHAADTKTTWKGAPLPVGVARLLWLSGAEPPPTVSPKTPIETPITRPPIVEHPNVTPRPPSQAMPTGASPTPQIQPQPGPQIVQTPLQQYQSALLDQFTAGFKSQNHLAANNVDSFVHTMFGDAMRCSTFRVRNVMSMERLVVRLQCHKGKTSAWESFDATLTVDAAGRIAALDNAGPTSEAY
jgi:CubicO group peptidase (beta-lactamase class C family)